MAGYAKLFSSIVTSTIWCEDAPTRIVWIAMLAMADSDGMVDGTIPGFANLARVSVDEMRKAIEILSSPDTDSRTPDNEGRRINTVPGGWIILNYQKYRDCRDADVRREQNRAAQIRCRERQAVSKCQHMSADVSNRQQEKPMSSMSADVSLGIVQRHSTEAYEDVPPLPPLIKKIEIPEDLEPNRKEIEEWLIYKRQKGQSYKEKGLNALFNLIRKIPQKKRKDSIENSMACNYAGIFEKNDSIHGVKSDKPYGVGFIPGKYDHLI